MYKNILRSTIIEINCNLITKCIVFNRIFLWFQTAKYKVAKMPEKSFYGQDLANRATCFLTNLKRLFYSVQYIHTEYISTDC